jgi:hypothetical protein
MHVLSGTNHSFQGTPGDTPRCYDEVRPNMIFGDASDQSLKACFLIDNKQFISLDRCQLL